jgi:hypothetical protein
MKRYFIRSKTSTNLVMRNIIEYFTLKGHVASRINTTGVYDPSIKRFRRGHTSAIGHADISIVLKPNGRHLEVEVKTGKDKPTDSQILRKERIEAAGGLYIFADSLADLLEELKNRNINIDGIGKEESHSL